jgi:hypothetical protein
MAALGPCAPPPAAAAAAAAAHASVGLTVQVENPVATHSYESAWLEHLHLCTKSTRCQPLSLQLQYEARNCFQSLRFRK